LSIFQGRELSPNENTLLPIPKIVSQKFEESAINVEIAFEFD
jgi:hypothetical protein